MGYARSQDNRKMAGENIVYSKGNGVERKCFLLKVPWPFLHKVQEHINPKGAVALLILSAPTYKP